MDDQTQAGASEQHEFPIGSDRLIVVYLPPDLGVEIDAVGVFTIVADDASQRAEAGWKLASLDTMNLRHAGVYLGREGSGFETKVGIVALYSRTGAG